MREEIPLVFNNKIILENWIDNPLPGYVTICWRLFWMGFLTFFPKYFYYSARGLNDSQIDAVESLWEVRLPKFVFFISVGIYAIHYLITGALRLGGFSETTLHFAKNNNKAKYDYSTQIKL